MSGSLDIQLRQFDFVGLEQIEEYPSMKRTDTKFLLHRDQLHEVLENASDYFSILEIEGLRIAEYRNQYYDTEHLKFYLDHHNGRQNRIKVRLREYLDSDIRFLEIKKKNNKGVTNKVRTRIGETAPELLPKHKIFLATELDEKYNLSPSLRNRFRRITLVNIKGQERVTLDFGLSFESKSKKARFDNLVVAEVKQYRNDNSSPAIAIFSELGIRPSGFSKYCIGLASLDQGLKQNRFKQKIRIIKKITA